MTRALATFSAHVIAGNFVNTDILGSMEFACKVAGAKLDCGFGTFQMRGGEGERVTMWNWVTLTDTLRKLKPALSMPFLPRKQMRNSQNSEFVQRVAEKNVSLTMEAIRGSESSAE